MNFSNAIQWNTAKIDGVPIFANLCKDHPAVRPVSYMEVNKLIGTSGCSKDQPYWVWTVMGVIETFQGKLLVCPGDWIIEILPNHFVILSDEEYKEQIKK